MLSCLAVSMTATSALLGWLSPRSEIQTVPEDENTIRLLAEDSVWRDVLAYDAGWRRISFVMAPSPRSGIALTGLDAQTHGWHFQIDEAGRTISSPLWVSQQAISSEPTAIRILLPNYRSADQVSPALWVAVRSLVSTLATVIPENSHPLAVSLPDRLDQLNGLDLASILFNSQNIRSSS